MKIIVSHDIDHLTAWEHGVKDTILPKYIARMHIEVLKGTISISEYALRLKSFLTNKWNHIPELIAYNNSVGIPSQFFIGMNNGVGLSYSLEMATKTILQFKDQPVDFGVHGIAFDDKKSIADEHGQFQNIVGANKFGIRMHYVRKTMDTMRWIAESGYTFDSTEHSFGPPYKIGAMWEFPFQIMDSWIMEQGKRWQSVNLEQAKALTLQQLAKAENESLPYLGIIFHDHYFSEAHRTWKDWYIWFTGYLKKQGYAFIRFEDAIKELEP